MKKSRTSSQQNHPGYTPWALVTVEDDALDYFSSSNNKWNTQRNHPLSEMWLEIRNQAMSQALGKISSHEEFPAVR
jgi:hypothetical protein